MIIIYPKCYTPKTLEWDSPPLDKSRPIISYNNNSSIIESTKVKSDYVPTMETRGRERGRERERQSRYIGQGLFYVPCIYPGQLTHQIDCAGQMLLLFLRCGKVPVRKRGFIELWTRTRCLVLLITRIEVLLQNDCCCGLIFKKICWIREITELLKL